MVVNGAQRRFRVETADFFDDIDSPHHFSVVIRKNLEHENIVGGQIDGTLKSADGEAAKVDTHAPENELIGVPRLVCRTSPSASPQQGVHSSQQLPERKGLRQVIVRSQLESN